MAMILGIESTCDETAAAVVCDGTGVHCSVVSSQAELHAKYLGVVPEIVTRVPFGPEFGLNAVTVGTGGGAVV